MSTRKLWTLMAIFAVAFVSCAKKSGKKSGPPGKERPVEAATPDQKSGKQKKLSKDQKKRLKKAISALEEGSFSKAISLLSPDGADSTDAPLVIQLYLARAKIGALSLQMMSKGKTNRSIGPKAIETFRKVARQASAAPLNRAASIYEAVAIWLVRNRLEFKELSTSFETAKIPAPVLERDRPVASLVQAEFLRHRERYMQALEVYHRVYRHCSERAAKRSKSTANKESKQAQAGESSVSCLDWARARGFQVASQLSSEASLKGLLEAEKPYLKAIGTWALFEEHVNESVSEKEYRKLEKNFNRNASTFLEIGAAQRAGELSRRLTSLSPDGRPVTIGAVLPLSGSNSDVGENVLASMMLAMEAFGSRRSSEIALVFQDSTVSAKKGFQRLKQHGVRAIVGPLSREKAVEYGRLATDNSIPIVTLTTKSARNQSESENKNDNNYVFRNFIDARSEAEAIARLARRKLNDKRVAILYPKIGYGKFMAERFRASFVEHGGKVAAEIGYKRDSSNYSELAKKLSKKRFDAVFIPDTGSKVAEISAFLANVNIWGVPFDDRPGTIQKQEGDRKMVHYLGTSLWQSPDLRHALNYLEGAIIPAWFSASFQSPGVQRFVDKFRGVFQRLPQKYEVFGYDTVSRLRRLVLSQGMRSPSQIRRGLTSAASSWSGVSGTTHFSERGEPVRDIRFVTPLEERFEPLPFDIRIRDNKSRKVSEDEE